ncbi:MAG: hypothetical protein N2652_00190 [Kiritimatiellae bacterium]|nr:hypothetical protein [Kiritimatiellia bacterium]
MHSTACGTCLLLAGLVSPAVAGPIVSNLLAGYDEIATVRCDVHREATGPQGTVRRLSRVIWARPDRLLSETFSPLRRRVVSDGTTFWSYVEGDLWGFSRAVAELDEDMRRSLLVVPGTPMDLLLRWATAPEREQGPPSNGWRRIVIGGTPAGEVVLDPAGRPAQIAIYRPEGGEEPLAVWTYSGWVRSSGGAWIPTRHDVVLRGPSEMLRETTRFENYRVGTPVETEEFNRAVRALQHLRFTNEWSVIYGASPAPR